MKSLMYAALLLIASAVTATAADDWYPLKSTGTPTAGEMGMADWLEKPAGKFGRIERKGDDLIYNKKPIKLWGVNLCYGNCAPTKEMADKRAAFYPKYGINSVRLHKFVDGKPGMGIQSPRSVTLFDAEALDRMDYQVAKFKEAGIFVKLSAHFGSMKIGPDDKKVVPYAEEFGELDGKKDRISCPHSAFFYSPEMQELQTLQTVNLLKHRNPYTKLTYAEEPAVAVIEIINEQSILFFTSMSPLQKSATLRKKVGERFCQWLTKKYGGEAALMKAWGAKSLGGFDREGFKDPESLSKGTILPLGNPWYFDPDNLNGSQASRKQRFLDTLEFLYTLQREAYGHYVKGLRGAGYKGEILGSNWQAGRAFSHYANLHSDYEVGMIDRHNYFGGGSGRGGQGKAFKNGSMLALPGGGSLSSGLQQVGDRPFMLSEWIHCFPNEWGVEGPAIIGAYGMGLQGWDVSYLFQNGDSASFSATVGRDTWDCTAPQVLGIFPAVSRQVLRGDVKKSEVVAVRNVHVPSLFEGKLGFTDTVKQGYDDKELDSSAVPARALAAARCVVNFTPTYQETPVFDMKKYEKDGFVVSSTGQLRWKPGKNKLDGFFTMDTPGTQAVVGFADGQTCALADATIKPQSRYGAIYLTAPGKSDTLARSKKMLIVALARARNTGMKFNAAEDLLEDKGKAPILLEPVKAQIELHRTGKAKLFALDHDGQRSGSAVPVTGGKITIDTAKDKTPYYLVEFD